MNEKKRTTRLPQQNRKNGNLFLVSFPSTLIHSHSFAYYSSYFFSLSTFTTFSLYSTYKVNMKGNRKTIVHLRIFGKVKCVYPHVSLLYTLVFDQEPSGKPSSVVSFPIVTITLHAKLTSATSRNQL